MDSAALVTCIELCLLPETANCAQAVSLGGPKDRTRTRYKTIIYRLYIQLSAYNIRIRDDQAIAMTVTVP
jgi:hypothetical protein